MKTARLFLAVCVTACIAAVAAAQDANLIPNRLSCAMVGESASYNVPNGYIQKLTVIRRSEIGPEALVTILVENIYEGRVVQAQEITEKAGDAYSAPTVPAEQGVFVAVRNDIARVKGRDVVAGIVEINKDLGTEDQDVVEWWTCTDVPVFGIIKKVENGEEVWTLADWQESDGKPKEVVYGEDGSVRLVDAGTASAAGESIADKAAAVMKKAGEAASSAKDAIADTASAAGESIADKAAAVMKKASETASSAKAAIVDNASSAGESIADKAAAVMKKASETASSAKAAVVDYASAAGESIADKAAAVMKKASETASSAKAAVVDNVSAAGESIADKAAAVMKKASSTASSAKAAVVDNASAAGESIADKAAAVMKKANEKAGN